MKSCNSSKLPKPGRTWATSSIPLKLYIYITLLKNKSLPRSCSAYWNMFFSCTHSCQLNLQLIIPLCLLVYPYWNTRRNTTPKAPANPFCQPWKASLCSRAIAQYPYGTACSPASPSLTAVALHTWYCHQVCRELMNPSSYGASGTSAAHQQAGQSC